MRNKSEFRLAVALFAVGALIVPAVSQAHKKTYGATITAAAQNKNQVEGKLASTPRCLAQRSVGLFSSTGALEASVRTDATGGFKIQFKDLAPGTHSVTVKPRRITKNRRHRHICRSATTSIVVS